MALRRSVVLGRGRALVALIALLFLIIARPAEAEESCQACDNCYPGLPCYICGVYLSVAITGCCEQNDSGWAFCVNNSWGFYVDCNGPGECQCNDVGSSCEPLPPRLPG